MTDISRLMSDAIEAHEANQPDRADALYARVLELQPANPFALHNQAVIALARGELARAARGMELACATGAPEPALLGTVHSLAHGLFDAGYWEEARPWLQRAMESNPGDDALAWKADRARPRGYLAPEIHDPGTGQTLLRGAPREAATYVYAIDVVGTCNLRCPTCPVGNFPAAERPRGFMEPEVLERVLRKIAAESPAPDPEIWLFSWGEPLLHPRLPELIEMVRAHGLGAHLSSNLNVRPERIEAAIDAGPASLKISLSGFSPDTYSRFHVRGKLEVVTANMHRVREALEASGEPVRVWVGHHIYRDTEHESEAVRALCDELGFEYHPIAAFYQPLEKLVALAEGRETPDPVTDDLLEHPVEYLRRFRHTRRRDIDCELRSNQTVVNFDGSVALCCSVYDAPNMLGLDFLDASRETIESHKYEHPFCRKCMEHGLHYAASRLD